MHQRYMLTASNAMLEIPVMLICYVLCGKISHYVYGSVHSLYTGLNHISATHINQDVVHSNPNTDHL